MQADIEHIDGVDARIALALGVARLGEMDLRGWWRSHGVTQAGRYVLQRAFAHTWRHTALELDVLSAARRHDYILGRPTALHLFSDQLPFRRLAGAWLAEGKTDGSAPLLDRLQDWTVEQAIEDLRGWTQGATPTGEPVGDGLLLGKLGPDELDGEQTIGLARLLAAAYLDQDATLRPPYFDLRVS